MENPDKEKAADTRSWWRRINFPAVITLFAALAAAASAVYAYSQVQVAKQQSVADEQQQLLSLVINIEQEPALLSQATVDLTGSALISTNVEYENEVVADGEAGALIIRSLNGQGISSIEYTQVGLALEAGSDNALALTYFSRASSIAGDPDSLADALRNEALIRYQLGGRKSNEMAHQEMMRAVQVYSDQGATRSEFEQNAALSYLKDAEYQAPIKGCHIAQADLGNAANAITLLGSAPGTATSERNQSLMATDETEFKQYCQSGA